MLDFCTSNAQSCRKDYKPIGTANGSQPIGAGQTINQAVSNTLINAISKFDPKGSLDLAGKLINGELSEYDYAEANKKYNSIIQKEAEKLRQESVKGLDVTNYDSPYAMGSGIIISPGNIKVNTDYTGLTSKELKENNLLNEDYSFWDSKVYLWGGDSNGIYTVGADSSDKKYMSGIYGYHVLGALNAGGYIPYSNSETLQILKENPELAESYNANKGRISSMNDLALVSSTYMIAGLPTEQTTTGKVFHGDGDYYLPNGTSAVRISGDDVLRINFVNGVPTNGYGILNGKFVMSNASSGGGLVPAGGTSTTLGLPTPSQTSLGALPNPYQNAGSLTYTPTDLSSEAKNKISTSQKATLNQQERLYSHLTEDDFTGATKELNGIPLTRADGTFVLREDGKPYNHMQELSDAYRGLEKIQKSYTGILKNPNLDPELKQLYTNNLNKVEADMKRINDLFNPFGGILPAKQ
jgi:hypothetical protein